MDERSDVVALFALLGGVQSIVFLRSYLLLTTPRESRTQDFCRDPADDEDFDRPTCLRAGGASATRPTESWPADAFGHVTC